jgi:hypothetical protein
MKYLRRWHCHRSLLCCQYVDAPNCNGEKDQHRIARRWRAWCARSWA